MEMSKIIDRVRADDFQQLVQTVGKSSRALLSAADAETARLATTQVNCEPVNMAKQVWKANLRGRRYSGRAGRWKGNSTTVPN